MLQKIAAAVHSGLNEDQQHRRHRWGLPACMHDRVTRTKGGAEGTRSPDPHTASGFRNGFSPAQTRMSQVSGNYSRLFYAVYRSLVRMAAPILLQKRRHEQFAGTPLTAPTNHHGAPSRPAVARPRRARLGPLAVSRTPLVGSRWPQHRPGCRHVRSGRPDLLSYQTRVDFASPQRGIDSQPKINNLAGWRADSRHGAGISSADAPTPPPHALCWGLFRRNEH